MRQVFGFSRKPAPAPAAAERPARWAALPADVIELRDELSALLLDLDEHAAKTLRHLVVVHDELGRCGWPGVEALPVRVLRKARIQAEMLASREPSTVFADFVERLQLVEVAAGVRDGEEPLLVDPPRKPEEELAEASRFVEVSDTSFEEYEEMERSWVGTVPSGLGKTGREHFVDPPVLDEQVEPPKLGGRIEVAKRLERIEAPVVIETIEPPVVIETIEPEAIAEKREATPSVAKPEPPPLALRFEPPAGDDWVDFERD